MTSESLNDCAAETHKSKHISSDETHKLSDTLNRCREAFEKWFESDIRLPLEKPYSGDIATAFNAGWNAAKEDSHAGQ